MASEVTEQTVQHTCSECGTYIGHRPVVEMHRRPDVGGGAWEIFIADHNTQRAVVIGARDRGEWNVSPAFTYTEHSIIDPWAQYDPDGLKAMIQWRDLRIAELERQLSEDDDG